jgi:WD40 repeat protein
MTLDPVALKERATRHPCGTSLQGHAHIAWTVQFHPADSGILASGCLAGQVRIWDVRTQRYDCLAIQISPPVAGMVLPVCFEIPLNAMLNPQGTAGPAA